MIFGSLRFFMVTNTVFSSVGAEILAGGSVVAGWDQIERAGPKDDRQVTGGIERWSKINMEEQHYENEKSLPEDMVSDFLIRWHISRMMEQDRQVTRPDSVIEVDYIAQTSHTHVVQPVPTVFWLPQGLQLTRGRVLLRHTQQFFRGMFLAVRTQCHHLLLIHRGLQCPTRIQPMTSVQITSSLFGWTRGVLLKKGIL